jgi:hypothetical protein
MGKRALTLTALVMAVFWAQVSYAATWTPLKGGVELKDRPQINGKVLARIPAETRLKELGKRGYWVKVDYQGKIGWVPMNGMRLATGEEKPKIDIVHSHSKQSGRMYEHTFKIHNAGTAPFSGTVTLRGYISGEIAFSETFTFREQPIPVRGEREAAVRIKSDFTRLEYKVGM